ncbi:calcium release-activated calcium channel protein 1-like [Drosophila miranda]|uniref:calcium release-activated calcium channel protein 1-like n=1 Tax=Drosophila miranda TaxID=7229 RepID=UPI00143FB369|nr:calcium release-activated calcium channel protein 1-like [Drosophila miranda]
MFVHLGSRWLIIIIEGALPPESGDLGRVTRSPSTTLTNLPTSALLRPPQVAMVEVQLDHDTKVPPGMLVAFAICTTMLVAVHMLALMISTCILPNIEVVCNLHSISLVHESAHERLHWYIETAWAFSTLLGLILFLLEIAILCWVKFYDLSPPAGWSACVVLIPVMIIFLAFAIHFYRSLVTHKYEVRGENHRRDGLLLRGILARLILLNDVAGGTVVDAVIAIMVVMVLEVILFHLLLEDLQLPYAQTK